MHHIFLKSGVAVAPAPLRDPSLRISFLRSNVSVHPRRTLCAVVVERLVRCDYHLWLSRITILTAKIMAIMATTGESGFRSGAIVPEVKSTSAQNNQPPINNINIASPRMPARNILIYLFIFIIERQRSPDSALCVLYGGTRCSALFAVF